MDEPTSTSVTHRRTRLLLIFLVALAVMGGAVAAVLMFDGTDTEIVAVEDRGDELEPGTTEAPEPSTTTSTATSTTTTTAPRFPLTPVKPLPTGVAVPVLSKVPTDDRVIFLTIDDGMVRDPRVPELIIEHRIPVAVFVNEGVFREDPDYFIRVASQGGSINSHTRSHTDLRKLGASAQRNEICGMRDVIGEKVLFPGHLFRAPYGVNNATTQQVAGSCGINAILYWHAALNNGQVQLQQGRTLQPGDIVLSHFRPDLYDNIIALSLKALAEGFTFAPIDAYLPLP